MDTRQALALAVLAVAMGCFVLGKWRHDVVALGALLLGVLCGVVPADAATTGFGHPAVFTIATVLILSRALQLSGSLEVVAERIARLDDRPGLQTLALTAVATGVSAFMNNVGALALVMPVALTACEKNGRSPSLVLMPIAFGAILGGLITAIGTPGNLVVSRYRALAIGEPFGMFEFAEIGLPVALVGLTFMVTLGRRLLPDRRDPKAIDQIRFDVGRYVTELVVPHDSPAIGRTLADLVEPVVGDLELIGLVRSEVTMFDSIVRLPLRPGDVLIVRAASHAFDVLIRSGGLQLGNERDLASRHLRTGTQELCELVVPPGSRLEGRTPGTLMLHTRFGVNLIAIARRGRPPEGRLDDVEIRAGDVLLMQGDRPRLGETAQSYALLPLAARELRVRAPRRAAPPALLFVAAIVAASTGMLALHVAFGIAVLGLIATRSITIRELYEAVDWPVIVLIAAMLPLGEALETSGATSRIADAILHVTSGLGSFGVLCMLMAVTSLVSNVVNNAATALVMAPIGGGLATAMHAPLDPFLFAVVVGSSCSFGTPIGHQNNVLVMGPGGYRFRDYVRFGLPLSLVVLTTAALAIAWFRPLG
ncbi:MAG: SLC13 family permease [Planctomycetota bacterium]